MPAKLNINGYIGNTYGRLTIIEDCCKTNERGGRLVRCSCACGNPETIEIPLNYLTSGNTETCGCRSLPIRGSTFKNKEGLELTVMDYVRNGKEPTKLLIRFSDSGSTRLTTSKEVRNGSIKDLYNPAIGGAGYFGEGIYGSRGKDVTCYQTWLDMIKRCYAPKNKDIAKFYKDVEVCKEWHNYQTFAEWYYKYHIEGYRLDKDLKVIGTKVYSPETCTFIPVELNSFLTGGLKRGIHYSKSKGKWIAQCQNGEVCSNGKKRQTYLGTYINEEDALNAYKTFKIGKLLELRQRFSDVDTILFDNIESFIVNLK